MPDTTDNKYSEGVETTTSQNIPFLQRMEIDIEFLKHNYYQFISLKYQYIRKYLILRK